MVTRKTFPATHAVFADQLRGVGGWGALDLDFARAGLEVFACRMVAAGAGARLRQGRCEGAAEWHTRARVSSLGGFHFERIVEAVEIVEQPDGGGQFDDFALIEMLAQFGPEFVVHCRGVEGFAFGEFEGGFFARVEIGAGAEVCEVGELLFAPAVAAGELGVGGESILAAVDLRGADDDQFLEL